MVAWLAGSSVIRVGQVVPCCTQHEATTATNQLASAALDCNQHAVTVGITGSQQSCTTPRALCKLASRTTPNTAATWGLEGVA
jgi:hypothetical protein